MFAFVPGWSPVAFPRASIARIAALAAVVGLGGCAATSNSTTAQNVTPRVVADATDVEADGLPAQTPPSARILQEPDDPSEPFSRNYGGPNPAALHTDPSPKPVPVPAPAVKQALPADLPPDFRRKLVQAMAEAE